MTRRNFNFVDPYIFRLFSIRQLFLALLIISTSLSACLPAVTNEDDYQEGLLHSQDLSMRYGHIQGKFESGYMEYLRKRLTAAIPDEYHDDTVYRFVLINSSESLAAAAGGGFILISRGLIQHLDSEAELAFILSHELAHQYLGHTKLHLAKTRSCFMYDYEPELEIDADKYAIAMMVVAGYDPRPAVLALEKASQMMLKNASTTREGDLNIHVHPELRNRT